MEHDLELIIPRLEILEIEVCNILHNPGNIGKRIFSTQSYPGNSGSYDPYSSPILEILDRTIHTQFYPGNIRYFLYFWIFSKKLKLFQT